MDLLPVQAVGPERELVDGSILPPPCVDHVVLGVLGELASVLEVASA